MNWKNRELGDVLTSIKTGSTPPTSSPEFFDGSIAWFTPSDIGETKFLVSSSRTISELGLTTGKAKLFAENSLLVTCIGNIGRVGILNRPASSNQQITSLSFTSDVDVNFAYYWFLSNQKNLERLANQAVVPILNNERLQTIEFCHPVIEEQTRIAAILDKADCLRRQRRFAQTLSDSFLQSVFIKMFGDPLSNSMNWKTEFLGKLCSIPPHIGTITPARNEGEQICVRVGEVGGDYIDLKNCQYVSLTGSDLKRFLLHLGDIVLARAIGSESHLGKLSVMSHSSKPVVFDSHLMRLRLNNSLLLTPFFTQLLKTKGGRTRFMKQARRTAVQFNINGEQISEIEIPLPPLPLQEKFADIVQKFERIRRQQLEATRQAEHLFQTFLYRAFRGEL